MVKFIKLDARHNLFHRGYRYAFLFTEYSTVIPKSFNVELLVKQAEGYGKFHDNTFYGKCRPGMNRPPFYIGFKNEATATLVQLQV